jgi:hypothetical protein
MNATRARSVTADLLDALHAAVTEATADAADVLTTFDVPTLSEGTRRARLATALWLVAAELTRAADGLGRPSAVSTAWRSSSTS